MRKILHITDVHFGRDHQSNRSAALIELSLDRRPDVVVFSGDLTKRAKPSQFRQARQFVDALGAATVVVPGNHDVPLFRVWERVFSPFGAYRRHFDRQLEPVFEDNELLIVGINTAHAWTFTGGRVWSRRLAEVERRLAADAGRRFAIVVQHHQMIPVPGYGSAEVFRNARAAANALERGGADLVLSGHVHLSYLGDSTAIDETSERAIPVLFSGTASSTRGRGPEEGRNTCHWLEIDGDELRLDRLEWSDEHAGFKTAESRVLSRNPRSS